MNVFNVTNVTATVVNLSDYKVAVIMNEVI